jgi:hypothetical protein
MDGNRLGRMMDEGAIGKGFAGTKTASYELKPYEHLVLVNSTSGAITITLPPVAEAAGKCYSIICTTFVSAVTIADNDDSYSWSDETSSVSADGDGALYYSDGFTWWLLANIT